MGVDMYGEGKTVDNPDEAGSLMNTVKSAIKKSLKTVFRQPTMYLRGTHCLTPGALGRLVIVSEAHWF